MNKTKIICTIGPACQDREIIKQMIKSGMKVARFNFSHGTHESQKTMLDFVRNTSREINIPVAIMIDTKGPEIRTGKTKDGKIKLEQGKEIRLVMKEIEGTEQELSISYKSLPQEVEHGDHILIADGTVDLEVLSTTRDEILCKVIVGGEFGDKKNVNIPGVKLGLPAITEKDRKDIIFAVEQDADFIAASFIRRPEDVMEIREILNQYNSKIHIISKIENKEGVDNIDDIIEHSNGIMVARGDLGVQLASHKIPIIQKRIIAKCNKAGKPVVTATQMLDSMIHNPRPTRAESTDVANAIIDGTDAVMLSGETANGKYPVEAVKMMYQIAETTESSPEYCDAMESKFRTIRQTNQIQNALCYSATEIANDINASAIITPTLSGNTARLLGRYRLPQPIIAVTANEKTRNQLLIVADVQPIYKKLSNDTSEMLSSCIKHTKMRGYIEDLDKVVVVAGVPVNSRNAINLIKVYTIADILEKGKSITDGRVSGKVIKMRTSEEAFKKSKIDDNEILLVPYLDYYMEHLLKNIKGVIVQEVCLIPPEELKKKYPNLVVISDVKDAMDRIENGLRVTLDGAQGFIYEGEI